MARENGLVASECALERARAECDAECDRAKSFRHDYWGRIHAITIDYRSSFNFDRTLEEH
jgi:hypothetical protein